jgi:hypothetical protein
MEEGAVAVAERDDHFDSGGDGGDAARRDGSDGHVDAEAAAADDVGADGDGDGDADDDADADGEEEGADWASETAAAPPFFDDIPTAAADGAPPELSIEQQLLQAEGADSQQQQQQQQPQPQQPQPQQELAEEKTAPAAVAIEMTRTRRKKSRRKSAIDYVDQVESEEEPQEDYSATMARLSMHRNAHAAIAAAEAAAAAAAAREEGDQVVIIRRGYALDVRATPRSLALSRSTKLPSLTGHGCDPRRAPREDDCRGIMPANCGSGELPPPPCQFIGPSSVRRPSWRRARIRWWKATWRTACRW